MITFVPAWEGVSSGEVSTDDLIGPMRSLQASGEPFQIVVTDYLPNLRYFLHRFDLLESNYLSIFDRLQGFEGCLQDKITLEDLNFPEEVHYIYSPFSVLVYSGNACIGEVWMAEGGHISEVKYFENQNLSSIEVYDDRGFLSTRKIFEEGVHICTEYIDSSGRCIFVHFQEDGGCAVNYDNTKGLLRKYYESLEALVSECLEAEFMRSSVEKIIFSVHEKNKLHVSRSNFLGRMVISYFSKKIDWNKETQYIDRFLLLKSRAVIVDTQVLYENLSLLTDEKKKINKISPFDTRFMLSISQEMKDEVIYVDARGTTLLENQSTLESLFHFACDRMIQEDEERSFKFLFRTDYLQKDALQSFYSTLVTAAYPEEIALIEEFNLDEGGENALEMPFLKTLKSRLAFVKKLKKSYEGLVFEGDDKLFEILHETRLLIDLSSAPDLFTQIAGISSGIPQLNSVVSDYVEPGGNGLLLSPATPITEALVYYLDRLKPWQEARTFSVQQIKRYSGVALSQKLLSFFEREYYE